MNEWLDRARNAYPVYRFTTCFLAMSDEELDRMVAEHELELQHILAEHELWLVSFEIEGTKADLSGRYLQGADFNIADLRGADFSGAMLTSS